MFRSQGHSKDQWWLHAAHQFLGVTVWEIWVWKTFPFWWVNQLFLWPCSIAMLNYQRVLRLYIDYKWAFIDVN